MDINLYRTHRTRCVMLSTNASSLPTILAFRFVLAEKINVRNQNETCIRFTEIDLNIHFLLYYSLTDMVFP